MPRQPQNPEEAVVAVNTLVKEGANFSIGLGQINRQHFDVTQSEVVFDPCTNLRMTAKILGDCYASVATGGATCGLPAIFLSLAGQRERYLCL